MSHLRSPILNSCRLSFNVYKHHVRSCAPFKSTQCFNICVPKNFVTNHGIIFPKNFFLLNTPTVTIRNVHTTPWCLNLEKSDPEKPQQSELKKSKWQLLKEMYKNYWYITIPVHVVTSIGWFGLFYYIASSGFDIVSYLEYLGVSERFVSPFRDSKMGLVAVSYALYKIFTPFRYTVTIGGTTLAIRYLKRKGFIKPVPTTEELRTMYTKSKDALEKNIRETRAGIRQRKDNISSDITHYRKEMKKINQGFCNKHK